MLGDLGRSPSPNDCVHPDAPMFPNGGELSRPGVPGSLPPTLQLIQREFESQFSATVRVGSSEFSNSSGRNRSRHRTWGSLSTRRPRHWHDYCVSIEIGVKRFAQKGNIDAVIGEVCSVNAARVSLKAIQPPGKDSVGLACVCCIETR